ncbi:AraC family transcriptional regulator [Phytoactinopolyspora halotolerans]|uniref:AraC family transcriptional regulator n=1 Tax=Phytoactinopolyspora halotolerans TaxID=1981512 RepID=A0A6L9SAR3_9ACTN|nr:AraC family transcriptional regulator [Phytoactinopolyspora halotolerans]NEE01714.1 AraC family transcriptional regulator [Phytoactinopolyspora halotolerans]
MDALAGMMHEVRSSGSLFGRTIMGAPWAIRFEDGAPLTLVTMVRGNAWIVPDGGEPVQIRPKDTAIVVGPEPFTVTDDPSRRTVPLYVVLAPDQCVTASGKPVEDALGLTTRTCGDSLDSPNVLLTGTYQVAGQIPGRLLSALPQVLVVPDDGGPCPIFDLTVEEIAREDPGQQAVLDRLLDLILLSTLREWFARPGSCPPPWYRASSDPTVGPALRAMHDEPTRTWTVETLAREAGVSRATFARRFTELLGEPPMAYLTGWRLSMAADLLQRTDATVESIARKVGYSNAYALSVAFKRHFGIRPSGYRAGVSATFVPAA